MKTFKDQIAEDNCGMLHLVNKNILGLAALFVIFLTSCTTPTVAQRVEVGINFNLPSWAPYYANASTVRYYYLPDIECYYDVMNREFIYMEDGEWMFGRSLPPIYAWFDLNNCFIVALNARVFEPWRHFHYYVAHYPRFYYRTVYRDIYRDRNRHLRGFNENERNVVFNHRSEMEDYSRSRSNNDYRRAENNVRQAENNRIENRQENAVRRDFPERRVEPTHPAEPMKYYGREVGRPVKVQRNMKQAVETKAKPEKQVKTYRQR